MALPAHAAKELLLQLGTEVAAKLIADALQRAATDTLNAETAFDPTKGLKADTPEYRDALALKKRVEERVNSGKFTVACLRTADQLLPGTSTPIATGYDKGWRDAEVQRVAAQATCFPAENARVMERELGTDYNRIITTRVIEGSKLRYIVRPNRTEGARLLELQRLRGGQTDDMTHRRRLERVNRVQAEQHAGSDPLVSIADVGNAILRRLEVDSPVFKRSWVRGMTGPLNRLVAYASLPANASALSRRMTGSDLISGVGDLESLTELLTGHTSMFSSAFKLDGHMTTAISLPVARTKRSARATWVPSSAFLEKFWSSDTLPASSPLGDIFGPWTARLIEDIRKKGNVPSTLSVRLIKPVIGGRAHLTVKAKNGTTRERVSFALDHLGTVFCRKETVGAVVIVLLALLWLRSGYTALTALKILVCFVFTVEAAYISGVIRKPTPGDAHEERVFRACLILLLVACVMKELTTQGSVPLLTG